MRVDQVSPSQLRAAFLLASLSNKRYVRFFNRLVLSIKRVKNNEKLFLGLSALGYQRKRAVSKGHIS